MVEVFCRASMLKQYFREREKGVGRDWGAGLRMRVGGWKEGLGCCTFLECFYF